MYECNENDSKIRQSIEREGVNLRSQELGKILGDMYNNAPHGDQVAKIHLFGVKFAEVILRNNLNVKEIIESSGIKPSYAAEVSKGIRLSRYVTPKE